MGREKKSAIYQEACCDSLVGALENSCHPYHKMDCRKENAISELD